MYRDVDNLCGWAMLQKLSVENFNFQFGKDYIENYNEDCYEQYFLEVRKIVMKNIFLKWKFNILKNNMTATKIYPFCPKE